MSFVSITRLKVKSVFYIFSFLKANEASVKELVRTDGFIAGKELIDKGLIFWTLTVWKDDASMRSFRNSIAHRNAMQKLPSWCNEASYAHWLQESEDIPGWSFASEKLLREGKLTKVREPSQRQLANSFPGIKWTKLERVFKKKFKSSLF